MKGKTSTGFKYEIDEQALDDMELLEVFAEVDENPLLLPKLLNMLLGKEQKEALYDHLRTDKGTVPTAAIGEEVGEILTNHKKTKNS